MSRRSEAPPFVHLHLHTHYSLLDAAIRIPDLGEQVGDTLLYPVSCAVEKTMWDEKALFANADFFHAAAYHFIGIPTKLFTPIFVCSRVTGWTAHVIEQRVNNRIIRPSAEYVGPDPRSYTPIHLRG